MKRFFAPVIALILGVVAATAVHSNMKTPRSPEPIRETVLETVDWPALSTPMTMMQGYDRYLSEPNFDLMPTQNA
jgi:hypothetical protein